MIESRSIAETLADIRQEKDVEVEVRKFARALGFDTYTLGYINPAASERAFFIDNHPEVDLGISDAAERDPVLARLKGELSPFHWNHAYYAESGNADIWEAGSQVGLSAGIVAPVRPGGGRRMVISLDRGRPLDASPAQLQRQLSQLDHFARFMAGTVVSLFDSLATLDASLSAMEKEVLRWTFAGLPPYEMARKIRPHRGDHGDQFIQTTLASAASKLGTDDPITASIMAARAGVLGAV